MKAKTQSKSVVAGAATVDSVLISNYANTANTYSDAGRALVDAALACFIVPATGKGKFAVYPEALKFNTSEGKAYLKRDTVFKAFHDAVYDSLKQAKAQSLSDSGLNKEDIEKKADAHAADYRTQLYRFMRAARDALLSGGKSAAAKVTKAKRGTKEAKKGIAELNVKDALAIWKRCAASEAPSKDDIVVQGLAKDMLTRYGFDTEGKKTKVIK